MSIKDAVFNAEDLVIRTWEVASLALSIQEGIYYGMFAVEHYEGAMNVLVEKAEAVSKQANEAINGLFDAVRENG